MRPAGFFGLFTVILATCGFAQDDVPIFKTEAKSAFVWGKDVPLGAVSSLVKDALTGSEILNLRHGGVDVSSRIGFERRQGQTGEVIAYTTTIINNSNENLSVKYGETTIDGRIVAPLFVLSGLTRPHRKRVQVSANSVDIATLYCFSSGFLTDGNFFPLPEQSGTLTVEPQSSVVVSTVIKDPRYYSILCSRDGCLPKGTVAYSIQVGTHDFIFIRPGRTLADCGKMK
jgi:hypothetical protein